ncbi:hypothetical protein MCOR08_011885 [Pyricularia oryzae]|nr:hypothetical protein MCOR08_011885 [Pyricularia oryzae]
MSLVPAGPAVSIVDSIAGPIVVRRTQDEIWIILPISSANNRTFFRTLAINSRGRTAVRCPSKCGNPNAFPKFRHCVRLPPYYNGACAKCIWQSRVAQCSHHHAGNVPPAGSDGGSSHDCRVQLTFPLVLVSECALHEP